MKPRANPTHSANRHRRSSSLQRASATLAAAFALAGCAVGPDFEPPTLPPAADGPSYGASRLPDETAAAQGVSSGGGDAQQFAKGMDVPALWWHVFRSEPLDRLIRGAIEHSPTLASAQATLRQAQENFNAQSGSLLYPGVTAQVGAQRQRASVAAGAPLVDYNLFNASVNVSYALDVFGGNRRTLEGLAAAIDYQQFQVQAVYLTLTSNLVTTAILEASLRAQLEATREVLALQTRQVDVVQAQFKAGAIARSSVLSQQTQAAQTRATIPALEKALAQARHQLSVYAGRLPSESGMPEFDLGSLHLPRELPVSLPSSLVRQRPDIRASEALLHQASAQIGVATANLYPQINLTAGLGTGASKIGDLFGGGTTLWSLAAGLAQPIFNGGALNAKKRAAVAAYDQALAQHRGAVLNAFQNVADVLRAIEADAQALSTQAEAAGLARESLDLATRQYRLGAISFLVLLDAQRTYQQTRISLVQAQAARYADTAALFQALGGGWWNRALLEPATLTDGTPAPAKD